MGVNHRRDSLILFINGKAHETTPYIIQYVENEQVPTKLWGHELIFTEKKLINGVWHTTIVPT